MVTTFDRDDIADALHELVDVLATEGETARVRIVGGAAIALSLARDATTTDIDALYGRSDGVDRAVARIAARRGWPDSWLNDKVKMFASHFDDEDDWTSFLTREGVEIRIAGTRLLLAMKLRAARGFRDAADIDLLLEATSVASVPDAIEIYEHYYPEDELPQRALTQLVPVPRIGDHTAPLNVALTWPRWRAG